MDNSSVKKDFEYFLPIRWAFHCYVCPPGHRWDFEEWREYLLSEKDWSAEKEVRAFQTDVPWHVLHFLDYNRVTTLTDFCEFNQRLEQEYLQRRNE